MHNLYLNAAEQMRVKKCHGELEYKNNNNPRLFDRPPVPKTKKITREHTNKDIYICIYKQASETVWQSPPPKDSWDGVFFVFRSFFLDNEAVCKTRSMCLNKLSDTARRTSQSNTKNNLCHKVVC